MRPNAKGAGAEGAIKAALLKFGQSSVDGCITVLTANLDGGNAGNRDSMTYRKKLYALLVQLGDKSRKCRSEENWLSIRKLLIKETNRKWLKEEATAAFRAMDPKRD